MAWNDLSIAQRSQLMNIMRQNGITSLSEMRRLYDLSSPSLSSLGENTFNMQPQAPVYAGGGPKKRETAYARKYREEQEAKARRALEHPTLSNAFRDDVSSETGDKYYDVINARYHQSMDALKRRGFTYEDASRLAPLMVTQNIVEGGWRVARPDDNNFGGLRENGRFLKFDSPEEYYDNYLDLLDRKWGASRGTVNNWRTAKNLDDWSRILNREDLHLWSKERYDAYNREHRDNPVYLYAPEWQNNYKPYREHLAGVEPRVNTYLDMVLEENPYPKWSDDYTVPTGGGSRANGGRLFRVGGPEGGNKITGKYEIPPAYYSSYKDFNDYWYANRKRLLGENLVDSGLSGVMMPGINYKEFEDGFLSMPIGDIGQAEYERIIGNQNSAKVDITPLLWNSNASGEYSPLDHLISIRPEVDNFGSVYVHEKNHAGLAQAQERLIRDYQDNNGDYTKLSDTYLNRPGEILSRRQQFLYDIGADPKFFSIPEEVLNYLEYDNIVREHGEPYLNSSGKIIVPEGSPFEKYNKQFAPTLSEYGKKIYDALKRYNLRQYSPDFLQYIINDIADNSSSAITENMVALGGPIDTKKSNKYYNGGPYGVIPLGGDYLSYLQTMPEVSGGMIEPSVVTAQLPSKFDGWSKEAIDRYAEGFTKGSRPVINKLNKAGQKIFKTADTIAGFIPGPVGAVDWLGHVGYDVSQGRVKKAAKELATAAVVGAGLKTAGRGISWLRNYIDDATHFGEDTFRAFTDGPLGKVGNVGDDFLYANTPIRYTGYSGYTPTRQSRAGELFVEDVNEAAEWGRFRGKPEAPKTKMYDFSGMEPLGSGGENNVYIDPDNPEMVLRVPHTYIGQPTVERAMDDALWNQQRLDNIYNARMNIAGFTDVPNRGILPVFSQKRMTMLPEQAGSVEEAEALKEAIDKFARRVGENPVYKWNYSYPINNVLLENDSGFFHKEWPYGWKDFKPDNIGFTDNGFLMGFDLHKNGGKIHIKPENRGKFTALKKRTGHSASWFKAHGTPAQRKMAVFALNARKWKHAHGGIKF